MYSPVTYFSDIFLKNFIHVYAHACISYFHCCIIFHCITVPQFYPLFCLPGLGLLFSVFTIEDNAVVDILPICNVNSVFLAVFSVENMTDTGQILNKCLRNVMLFVPVSLYVQFFSDSCLEVLKHLFSWRHGAICSVYCIPQCKDCPGVWSGPHVRALNL